jgi:hypothetical protein
MSGQNRITPVDASPTDGGYFNEQVIYIDGLVSMSDPLHTTPSITTTTPSR